ncbi:isoleucine--tRNA ligase, partial [Nonomuraea sp. MG754425]|uniref:DUF5915 domain-containing protein n=1 Tax=Nonomuraea sp. MG754425 TaxID=2570319 RepID=UPI001F269B47
LRSGATVMVEADELGEVMLGPDEVIVNEQPRSGWAVETGAIGTGTGETVALDLELTDELRRAGLLREVIRLVQEARKSTGLSITDRIHLWWTATGPDLAAALRSEGHVVGEEVLATGITEGTADGLPSHSDADLGLTFQLRRD